MQSETVVLRKELHEVHARLDASAGVTQSVLGAMESLRMDLVEETARRKRSDAHADEMRQNRDIHARRVKVLENLLKENNIQFDTDGLAAEDLKKEKESIARLEEELKKTKAKHRRVSNENSPSSTNSDAQYDIQSYRADNKDNYHPLDGDGDDDNKPKSPRKGSGKKQESRNLLLNIFGRKSKMGKWFKPKSTARTRKKPTLEEIPVSHTLNCTVDNCPSCGGKADVKTVVMDVVDTAPVQHADTKSVEFPPADVAAEEPAADVADMPADDITNDIKEHLPDTNGDGIMQPLLFAEARVVNMQANDISDCGSSQANPPPTGWDSTSALPIAVTAADANATTILSPAAPPAQQAPQKTAKDTPPVAHQTGSDANATTILSPAQQAPQQEPQESENQKDTQPIAHAAKIIESMQTHLEGATNKTASTIATALGIRPAQKTRVHVSVGTCANGHKIDTTPRGLTSGTVFGPRLMTMMVFMFSLTLSLGSIRSMLVMFGIESVSRTTIMKALAAVAVQKFATRADYISKRLGDSWFLMADETKFKIGKKKDGYVWAFIGAYGIKIHVNPSRARTVVDLHFPYFDIPIVIDGYVVYESFKVRQRCWAHILREAELLAATHRGKRAELHQRLQSVLHAAKKIPSDISDEGLQGWIDGVRDMAAIYTELGHKFGVTLHNAAPDLFTFVRYPGMPPTNNMSERTLRPVVLHKKIRQMFRSVVGMQTYSTLMTCLLTWKAQDKDVLEKIHQTIMSN